MVRTTIVLKDRIARQVREMAQKEDRKLSNMIGLLVSEALEERERAARRVQHLGSVLAGTVRVPNGILTVGSRVGSLP